MITLTIVVALVLILLVGLLPREPAILQRHQYINRPKSGYWETRCKKVTDAPDCACDFLYDSIHLASV